LWFGGDRYVFAALPVTLLFAQLTAVLPAVWRGRLVAVAWLHTVPWLLVNLRVF